MRRLRRFLDAMEAKPLHYWLVGDAEQERVVRGFMEMRPPCRGGDDVAAAPLEALAVAA